MNNRLYEHPLWTIRNELLTPEERIRVTYERAVVVIKTWSALLLLLLPSLLQLNIAPRVRNRPLS